MLNIKGYRFIFIGWVVFVTFSSLYSFSGVNAPVINIPHADKMVHFFFYFGFVLFGVLATKEKLKSGFVLNKSLVTVVLAGILYGVLIELLQHHFTHNREGDVLDVLANTMGAVTGMFIARWLILRRSELK